MIYYFTLCHIAGLEVMRSNLIIFTGDKINSQP